MPEIFPVIWMIIPHGNVCRLCVKRHRGLSEVKGYIWLGRNAKDHRYPVGLLLTPRDPKGMAFPGNNGETPSVEARFPADLVVREMGPLCSNIPDLGTEMVSPPVDKTHAIHFGFPILCLGVPITLDPH